ncbi:MAG: tRNA (guanosine(37)-N1)-methyltransferase TrmD [Steroidobacteraceae bacterium]|nr:tRNA (guanosine(37)-N1)-methyltransferase TrmD [Nevskiaceae bacterium]MCP5359812.1 tRNA (guanosine(37)-N1)-methyltransferase TrmD [Nevskiaceae bacterium]MCP5467388.1 tRNA (guanosine(37)-N1)-methyltransferase TrmD [Nevskiaceae bacterium]MCP5472695.1 tRNA (guanosine(37)-N1)-methyltransferase TrmD [Nevskiaceae bacterium]
MQIGVVTLFPELVCDALAHGVLGRALERGLAAVQTEDPRAHAGDAHRTVDDRPYGGGPGMVGTPAPWAAAIDAAASRLPAGVPRLHLSAQGAPLTQQRVQELAGLPGFLLVASRYEGLDQRVIDSRIDGEISIGDYVLSGGEFAALVVIDAVVRLLPGALGDERSSVEESFAAGRLDWPHYTRPVEWEGRSVPTVLQGGNHAAIRHWRLAQSVTRTWVRRPDLIVQGGLSSEESRLLNEFLARREVDDNG